MQIAFHKYHGAGNDFILVDNRSGSFTTGGSNQEALIARLCDRHTGIGADGLILVQHPTLPASESAFRMLYFNADGLEGSLCGNGSRCAAAYAYAKGMTKGRQVVFEAVDGLHRAEILRDSKPAYVVRVSLRKCQAAEKLTNEQYYVDTGSPHLVWFTDKLDSLDVSTLGRKIRYDPKWGARGVNVNFAEWAGDGSLRVRTYERGVEEETLSCGTGAAAVALAGYLHQGGRPGHSTCTIHFRGGSLRLSFTPPDKAGGDFRDIWLEGPASMVFEGRLPV